MFGGLTGEVAVRIVREGTTGALPVILCIHGPRLLQGNSAAPSGHPE